MSWSELYKPKFSCDCSKCRGVEIHTYGKVAPNKPRGIKDFFNTIPEREYLEKMEQEGDLDLYLKLEIFQEIGT